MRFPEWQEFDNAVSVERILNGGVLMVFESEGGDDVTRVRELAVEKHDREASGFDEEYRTLAEDGYLATAFLLGRGKIDRIVYRELGRHHPSARILDVGCGTGSQVVEIRNLGFEVSGLEPASEMRRLATAANPGVDIRDGSITDLPYDDGTFDVVLALEVLRYLPAVDNETSWREMLRVLRPGGTIIVTMVNRWAIDGYWLYERVQTRRASRGSIPVRAHCEFVTPGQVRRDLARLGAGSVAIHGRLLLPLRWAYKASRPLGRVVARILNPVDDVLCRIPGTTGLTGHLVVVVRP